MNPDDKELTLEESIRQVMQTLPPFIRTYLREEKYTPVARGLMAKYGLRVDQGGVLERELMLLLMGIDNPVEFMDALKNEAHLDQGTIDNIVQDVNNQIFIPLRKEEETQSKTPALGRSQTSTAPQGLSYTPVPVPALSQPVRLGHLENKIPTPRAASPLGQVVRAVVPPQSFDSSKLLEDREEPHIEFNKQIPMQTRPISEVRPSPIIPKVEPQIPINLPGMPRPSEAFGEGGMPPRPAPAPIMPPRQVTRPLPPVTSYATDPYREPLDEPPAE